MWGSLFQSVLRMSLMAGVAIAVVLVARLLLRRAPKIFSYALWAIVLFRLCCPVAINSPLSLFGVLEHALPEMKAEQEYLPGPGADPESEIRDDQAGNPAVGVPNTDPIQSVTPEIGTVQQTGNVQGGNSTGQISNSQPGNSQPQPGNQLTQSENNQPQSGVPVIGDNTSASVTGIGAAWSAENWVDTASWIWVGGMLAMAVYSLVSVLSVRRRLLGAVPLRDNIYVCDYLETPFVMGVFRPRIYLCSTLKEHEMEYIILHEQHHIRRFDHVIKLLAFAVLCVHWFNPLVWVAFILAGKDMEMSCDEAVVKRMGERIRWDYSKSLLVLATGHQSIAGAPLAFGEGSTKGRIHNLLKKKKAGKWLAGVAAVVLVVAGVLLLTDPVGSTAGDPSGDVVKGQYGDDDPSEIENDQDQQTGQTKSGDQTEAPTGTEKEPDEIIVTMDDATRMQAIANSPEWAKEVWEKFNEYSEPVSIWIGDTYAGFMDQVVYDNGNGQRETRFPAVDYDGDGTVDRIYGNHNTGEDGVYLFSGSGEILLLGKPYWGFSGSTCSADLTGDGVNELIYISWVSGTGGETCYAAVWERVDGQWIRMDLTYSVDGGMDSAGNLHVLTLPLQAEKTGERSIRLIQPDVGKFFEHEIAESGSMSDLWLREWEDNDKSPLFELWSSGNNARISVVSDRSTGKSNFLVAGAYGNKWYSVPCNWLLGYENGEWKILDFWGDNESEKTLKQKMTDILWQRMVSMVLSLAPSDRDDWLSYWSGDNQVDMILGNFDEEDHLVYTEGKDNPWGRHYQVNAFYDQDKAYNTSWYWLEHYHDLSLAELCEGADGYLAYSYSHHGAYSYSEDILNKHRSEGLLEVTGSLKRVIYPAGESFLNQREIEGEYIDLWNAVMGAVSELYLEELGSIPERMAGKAYLMSFDPENLTAEFWICLEGKQTLYMTANYTWESCEATYRYAGDKSLFDIGYVYGFDETYVFPGGWNEENISQSAWLGLEFDLTTERLAD